MQPRIEQREQSRAEAEQKQSKIEPIVSQSADAGYSRGPLVKRPFRGPRFSRRELAVADWETHKK